MPRRETTTASVLATYLALLCAGSGLGLLLARVLGDAGPWALGAGAVTLPVALGLGVAAWNGLAKAWILARLWGTLRRPELLEDPKAALAAQFATVREGGPLPGAWVFLPVCLAVGLAGGLVVALAAGGVAVAAVPAFGAAGAAFGAVTSRLARQGRILPGEPS